jgi:Flp pilus assembly protein CpaB
MRAVSIDGRAADFDGLLRPGDRVDVLFTEGEATSTHTILQNVLVLSVGSDIAAVDETSGRTSTARGGTVTLAVSSEGAQIVTQAKSHGRLTLSLRNADDIAVVDNLPETSGKTLDRAGLLANEQGARKLR